MESDKKLRRVNSADLVIPAYSKNKEKQQSGTIHNLDTTAVDMTKISMNNIINDISLEDGSITRGDPPQQHLKQRKTVLLPVYQDTAKIDNKEGREAYLSLPSVTSPIGVNGAKSGTGLEELGKSLFLYDLKMFPKRVTKYLQSSPRIMKAYNFLYPMAQKVQTFAIAKVDQFMLKVLILLTSIWMRFQEVILGKKLKRKKNDNTPSLSSSSSGGGDDRYYRNLENGSELPEWALYLWSFKPRNSRIFKTLGMLFFILFCYKITGFWNGSSSNSDYSIYFNVTTAPHHKHYYSYGHRNYLLSNWFLDTLRLGNELKEESVSQQSIKQGYISTYIWRDKVIKNILLSDIISLMKQDCNLDNECAYTTAYKCGIFANIMLINNLDDGTHKVYIGPKVIESSDTSTDYEVEFESKNEYLLRHYYTARGTINDNEDTIEKLEFHGTSKGPKSIKTIVAQSVTVEYYDIKGEKHIENMKGLHAACMSFEHLSVNI